MHNNDVKILNKQMKRFLSLLLVSGILFQGNAAFAVSRDAGAAASAQTQMLPLVASISVVVVLFAASVFALFKQEEEEHDQFMLQPQRKRK